MEDMEMKLERLEHLEIEVEKLKVSFTLIMKRSWHSWKLLKDKALNKKYIAEKDDFEILRWPFVTFIDLWGHTLFDKKFASLQC